MTRCVRVVTTVLVAVTAAMTVVSLRQGFAAGAAVGVDDDANAALKKLYASEPVAKMIGEKAKAILVFPTIVKAGFIIGGQYGEGALLKDGQIVGHYNSVAASYGLQAGAQSFGYALFLMNDKALEHLDNSAGWEIGVGPTIVIVDKGKAKSLTTTTLQDVQFDRPVSGADLVAFQRLVRRVPAAEPVIRYALDIVRASRPKSPTAPDSIKKWAAFGASVRAAQYLVLGGKARALTSGRYHVSFDDIRALCHPVLRHRIITNFHAQSEGVTTDQITDRLLETVPMPRSGM